MLGQQKAAILQMANMLNRLQRHTSDLQLLLECQTFLARKIIRAERLISHHKAAIRQLTSELKTSRMTKNEASETKKKLDFSNTRIKKLNFIKEIWRTFGDGIAFIYLDKYAIKPLSFEVGSKSRKAKSGNLSGKSGYKKEWKVLKSFIHNGIPALLCDLTNSIRHGDICFLTGSDPILIEVKSSRNESHRTKRQLSDISAIHSFYEKDTSHLIFGTAGLRRTSISTEERNHELLLNRCASLGAKEGHMVEFPEPGLAYICIGSSSVKTALAPVLSWDSPIVFNLNDFKNSGQWLSYKPYTLSITDPEILYAFISGDIHLLVVVNPDVIRQLFSREGFEVEINPTADFPIFFKQSGKEDTCQIGGHYFARIGLEMMSIEWLVAERLSAFRRIGKELDSKSQI